MGYSYEITEEAAEEIDYAIEYFESQFTSGAADFLTAFDDTIEWILKMPESGQRRSEKDPDIRSRQVKADGGKSSYAKSFPYLLIYKVFTDDEKVVIFQLWPIRSNQPMRSGAEDE
ncbi:MAG: type II toxin-antitoxin system RelE/ParE family toxin [Bacteroidia bacterium]